MFSGMKMEEFMESEHSGIFRVELVTKNVVPGSSGTHFMRMGIKFEDTRIPKFQYKSISQTILPNFLKISGQ